MVTPHGLGHFPSSPANTSLTCLISENLHIKQAGKVPGTYPSSGQQLHIYIINISSTSKRRQKKKGNASMKLEREPEFRGMSVEMPRRLLWVEMGGKIRQTSRVRKPGKHFTKLNTKHSHRKRVKMGGRINRGKKR